MQAGIGGWIWLELEAEQCLLFIRNTCNLFPQPQYFLLFGMKMEGGEGDFFKFDFLYSYGKIYVNCNGQCKTFWTWQNFLFLGQYDCYQCHCYQCQTWHDGNAELNLLVPFVVF